MTPVFCCGFECGANLSHWIFAGSTNPSFSTATKKTGHRSLQVNVTNSNGWAISAQGVNAPPSGNVWIFRVYVYFSTLPSATVLIAGDFASTILGAYFNSSDNKIYAGSNGSLGATGVSVSTGTWYRLDVKLNAGTVDIQVDGTACGQKSGGSASNFGAINLGVNSNCTANLFFDDFLASQTAGDYPLGAGKVDHFTAVSDGTHNIAGTGDFQRGNTGVDILNSTTTAYQLVDDVPIKSAADNVDSIRAVAPPNATDYVECVFGAAPGVSTPTVAPRAVEVIAGFHQGGTQTGQVKLDINDNGTVVTVYNSGATSGQTTIFYYGNQFATPPTGGSWTVVSGNGNFNNLRFRFYSADAAPDQILDTIMVEAEFNLGAQQYTKNLSDTATLSDTAAKTNTFHRSASDSSTLSDLISKKPTANKSDATSLSDASVRKPTVKRADSITLLETFSRVYNVIRTFADTITLLEANAKHLALPKDDAITLSDSFSKILLRILNLSDSITLSDASSKKPVIIRSDLISLTDAISKRAVISRSDIISLSDQASPLILKILSLADSLTLSDSAAKHAGINKSDQISLSDLASTAVIFNRLLQDTVSLSDALVKNTGISRSDSITLIDQVVKNIVVYKTDSVVLSEQISKLFSTSHADGISLTDAMVKHLGISLSDAISETDATARGVDKILADIISLSDQANASLIGGGNVLNLSDSITLSDSISFIIGKSLVDSLSLLDQVMKSFGLSKQDAVTITDAISKHYALNQGDTTTITDELSRMVALYVNDQITLSDVITYFNTFNRTLSDTIHLSDRITKTFSANFYSFECGVTSVIFDKQTPDTEIIIDKQNDCP